MVNGDFSELLTNTPAMAIDPNTGNPTGAVALDCSGNQTFVGEIFNARLTRVVPTTLANPSGLCGVPIGVAARRHSYERVSRRDQRTRWHRGWQR